jgi:hypothetical protein
MKSGGVIRYHAHISSSKHMLQYSEIINSSSQDDLLNDHEGNTMRKIMHIMGNKPQVSSATIIQASANILEWPSAPGSDCWCFYN